MLSIGSYVDGKYKILNKIGQGGMSVVYLAMNERANKQWAIKEVRKDGVSNFEVVKQGLVAEIDLLKKLNHPNLPSIIDVIDGEDSFLIVMDYIEGVSLDKMLYDGALPQEDVIEWGKQLCDVLGYLHSRTPPIIYRDMKPANVMLKPNGSVMLIDFGTAREFKSQNVADTVCLGTVGYAAPEQFGGQGQTDARTDIYCLGATLYHLVTGHNPCEPPYEIKPITYWNPSLSTGLEEIILKCTQKSPADRYQSCAELMYALENYDKYDKQAVKSRETKWKTFISLSLASVIFLTASAGFKIKGTFDENNTYEQCISVVSSYTDFNSLKQAVSIYPDRFDAYDRALSVIDNDGYLDAIEYSKLMEILTDSNLKALEQKNPDAYRYLCYTLGVSFMFKYTGGSGWSQCQKWFKKIIDLDENKLPEESRTKSEKILSRVDLRNANALYQLSGVLYEMGREAGTEADAPDVQVQQVGGEDSVTGEKLDYTYSVYWKSLNDILDYDFFSELNNRTKLTVYNWIYNAMYLHKVDLVDDGVSVSELREKRDGIVATLTEMQKKTDSSSSISKEISQSIVSFQTVDTTW